MSAVALQKLVCEACSGPLDWDGTAPVIQCPQCATPHAIRWNEPARTDGKPATPPPSSPLRRLQALDAAWKQMDGQFSHQRTMASLLLTGSSIFIVFMSCVFLGRLVEFGGMLGVMLFPTMSVVGLMRLHKRWRDHRDAERQHAVGRYLEQRMVLLAEIETSGS